MFEEEFQVKILEVRSLVIPAVKVIRFGRFRDHRGYFAEHFRKSDFMTGLPFVNGVEFTQCNESHSKPGTIRGLMSATRCSSSF